MANKSNSFDALVFRERGWDFYCRHCVLNGEVRWAVKVNKRDVFSFPAIPAIDEPMRVRESALECWRQILGITDY